MLTKNYFILFAIIAGTPALTLLFRADIFVFILLPITMFGILSLVLSLTRLSRNKIILIALITSTPIHIYGWIVLLIYGPGAWGA